MAPSKPSKPSKPGPEPGTKPKTRAKRGGSPSPPVPMGRVAEYLQKVAAAYAGGQCDSVFTARETARLALYHMTDPDCSPGLVSAFLRIKLDAERQMHKEELAGKGIFEVAHVITGPQAPPPGATDPPELP